MTRREIEKLVSERTIGRLDRGCLLLAETTVT
jgi:hypothetical protein